MAKKQNTIGFHKPKPDLAEEHLRGDEEEDDDKQGEQYPNRMPLVVPVFVDELEVNEILGAYNIFPLTPLSRMEYQLVQVIAALEQEVKKYRPD